MPFITISITLEAKGAVDTANTAVDPLSNTVPKGSIDAFATCTSCKTTRSTHSANVVTKYSARLLPQHSSVAEYLNMLGTATVAFLDSYRNFHD